MRSVVWLAALLLLGLSAPARADFGAGLAAYDAGDYQAALAAWQPLAEAGDNEARLALASLHLQGLGVPRDEDRAFALTRQAAREGHALAQLNLGEMHEQGRGTVRNLARAWAWYSLSAEQGRDWAGRQARRLWRGFSEAEQREARSALQTAKSGFLSTR